jgi:phage N-6-adenine-methyltransferase
VYFSSESDNWPTDPRLFAELDRKFGFNLDVCASAENFKCPRYFTAEVDGLSQPWTGRVWCNPPYGHGIGRWIRKGWESVQSGEAELVVLLVPAKTDTRWWHQWCVLGEIRFFKGRLRFGEGKYPAPFPSALVVLRDAQKRHETGAVEALPEAS